jgi:hypothetical protein
MTSSSVLNSRAMWKAGVAQATPGLLRTTCRAMNYWALCGSVYSVTRLTPRQTSLSRSNPDNAGGELGPRCSRNWSKPIHTTRPFPSGPRQTIPRCVFMDASDSKSRAKTPIQLGCNGTFEILPILHERDTEKIIENSWRLQEKSMVGWRYKAQRRARS